MTGVAPFSRGDVCLWRDKGCVVVSRKGPAISRAASAEERAAGYLYTVRCIGHGMRTEDVPHGDLAPLLPPGAHPPPRPARLIKHPPLTEREQAMGLIIYYLDRDLLEMDARVQEKPAPKFEEREPRRGDIVLTNNGAKWLWRGRRAEGGMMYFSVSLEGGHYAHRATPDRPSTSRVLVQSKLEQRLGELALFWEEQSEKRFSILEQCARAFSEAGHPGPLSHEDLPRAIREALTVPARKSPEEAYPDTTHVEAAIQVLFEDGRVSLSVVRPPEKADGSAVAPLWWIVGDSEFVDAAKAARAMADLMRGGTSAGGEPKHESRHPWHEPRVAYPVRGETVWAVGAMLVDGRPTEYRVEACIAERCGDHMRWRRMADEATDASKRYMGHVVLWSYATDKPAFPNERFTDLRPPPVISAEDERQK